MASLTTPTHRPLVFPPGQVPEFYLFSQLPPEIREMIWRHAIPRGRFVRINVIKYDHPREEIFEGLPNMLALKSEKGFENDIYPVPDIPYVVPIPTPVYLYPIPTTTGTTTPGPFADTRWVWRGYTSKESVIDGVLEKDILHEGLTFRIERDMDVAENLYDDINTGDTRPDGWPQTIAEVQGKVWRYCGKREGIELDYHHVIKSFTPVPVVLHVSQESRYVALKTLKFMFPTTIHEALVPVDLESDIIYFSWISDIDRFVSALQALPRDIRKEQLSSVTLIGSQFGRRGPSSCWLSRSALCGIYAAFPNLQKHFFKRDSPFQGDDGIKDIFENPHSALATEVTCEHPKYAAAVNRQMRQQAAKILESIQMFAERWLQHDYDNCYGKFNIPEYGFIEEIGGRPGCKAFSWHGEPRKAGDRALCGGSRNDPSINF